MNADSSSPKPSFEARRVVGTSGRRATARAVVVSASPRRPGSRWNEPTDAAFGPFARLGLVLLALSIIGLLLVLTLPWMHEVGGENSSRTDLQENGPPAPGLAWDDERPYTRGLTRTPVSASILLGIAGFLLVVADAVPASRLGQSIARVLLLGAAGFFSLRLAVVAARWIGLYVSHALEPGPVDFQLHAGLYIVLLLGLSGIGATQWGLRRAFQPFLEGPLESTYPGALPWSAWTAVLAAAVLVLSSVLPVASNLADGVHLSELQIMQGGDPPVTYASEGLHRTVEDLAVTRLMFWLILALASLATLAALLERTGLAPLLAATLLQTYALNYLLLGVATVMTVLLYGNHIEYIDRFPGMRGGGGFAPYWNWFAPAGLVALAYVGARFGISVVVPFVRREVRASEDVTE